SQSHSNWCWTSGRWRLTVRRVRATQSVLAVAAAVGGMGMAAGGAAGALVAVELTGRPASAGLPLGAVVLGSALGALLISWLSRQTGRVTGLVAGYVIGAAGAAIVVAATM